MAALLVSTNKRPSSLRIVILYLSESARWLSAAVNATFADAFHMVCPFSMFPWEANPLWALLIVI